MKRKIILFGSIFVLALMLLMPSIPAIQQKAIEDKTYNDLVEKFEDVDADFIELLNDVDLEDLQDKIVNSETFEHLSSSDFIQKLLNNDYDFESKIDLFDILFNFVIFIVGLITWIPAIIFSILIAIPMILSYTIITGWYEFLSWSYPSFILFILSFIIGFVYGISNWLGVFIPAIIWPLALIYIINNYNPPGPLQDIV